VDECRALPQQLDLSCGRLSALVDSSTSQIGQLNRSGQDLSQEARSSSDQANQQGRMVEESRQAARRAGEALAGALDQAAAQLKSDVQRLDLAVNLLATAAESALAVWLDEQRRAVSRLDQLSTDLSHGEERVRMALAGAQQALLELGRQLAQDAVQAVPAAFSPVLNYVKTPLPDEVDERCGHAQETVHVQYDQYSQGAMQRAKVFGERMEAFYQELMTLERQVLPARVQEALASRTLPTLHKVSAEVLRARRSTFSGGNIAKEFGAFQGLILFLIQYFEQQAQVGAMMGSAPASRGQAPPEDVNEAPPVIEAFAWPESSQSDLDPNAPFFRPPQGEEHLWTQRGDGSWVHKPATAQEMLDKYGYQDMDSDAAGFRVPPGQESQWEKLADGSWARVAHLSAAVTASADTTIELPPEEPPVVDLPEVTTAQTVDEVPVDSEALSHSPLAGMAHDRHVQEEAQARLEAVQQQNAQPVSPQAGGGQPVSQESKTIGGFEDNSRELYEKMRGGQNTSKETLEMLRQQTIEKANALHHGAGPEGGASDASTSRADMGAEAPPDREPSASRASHSSVTGAAVAAAHLTDVDGEAPSDREAYEREVQEREARRAAEQEARRAADEAELARSHAVSPPPVAPPEARPSAGTGGQHQTIGGFEDNSREVYDKMHGGQNTPKETLEMLRQQTIDHANAQHHGGHARNLQEYQQELATERTTPHSAAGDWSDNQVDEREARRAADEAERLRSHEAGLAAAAHSEARPAGGQHQTIGGFEDNSREVYDRMHGGQNTPKETLEMLRQQTIEHANALHHGAGPHGGASDSSVTGAAVAAGHLTDVGEEAPPDREASEREARRAADEAQRLRSHEAGLAAAAHSEARPAGIGQHQTIGGFEDNSREVYDRMHGGQNTPKETLEMLRQQTIEHANALHHGGGPVGGGEEAPSDQASEREARRVADEAQRLRSHEAGLAHANQSGARPAGSGQHQTIGGFEDNSREVYDRMHGGQNTPKETLEMLRQQTIEHANALHHGGGPHGGASDSSVTGAAVAAAHLTDVGEGAPPDREAYEREARRAADEAERLRSHEASLAAVTHSEAPPTASTGGQHQTIGGFEDNSREVYDRMHGGQNTPKETLEMLRQQTIDHANAQHQGGGSAGAGEGKAGSRSHRETLELLRQQSANAAGSHRSESPPAAAPEHKTLGGFEDNTQEVYKKTRGGRNTPKETLEMLRQQTIDNAAKKKKDRESS
jgi:hypothetical protein